MRPTALIKKAVRSGLGIVGELCTFMQFIETVEMKVEQCYTACLAQGAYYITSRGEAAVIDPLRDPQPYLQRAEREGVLIKYILETHFHADFISGHLDLARETGATIVYGPGAQPAYDVHIAQDGEILNLGAVQIKVLHTPGHTFESVTYLLIDEMGRDHALFTGDALFLGDVGRPDLAQSQDVDQAQLAGILYDSLREKILPLGDHVIVYPGHGAGSACGKNMSKDTWGTLGEQKKTNYALQEMSKAEFTEKLLDGLAPPPQYFPKNAVLNQKGATPMEAVYQRALKPLSPVDFQRLAAQRDALVLDLRSPEAFVEAHIPDALFIGLDGQFAPWVGTLIADLQQPLLLVVPTSREKEAVQRLARVGYDQVLGYLQGGIQTWKQSRKPTARLASITAGEFAARYDVHTAVLDVRREGEYEAGHLKEAQLFPLDLIFQNRDSLSPETTYFLHCAGGYRSVIAASILKRGGLHELVNIAGGYRAIKTTDLPRTKARSEITLKR